MEIGWILIRHKQLSNWLVKWIQELNILNTVLLSCDFTRLYFNILLRVGLWTGPRFGLQIPLAWCNTALIVFSFYCAGVDQLIEQAWCYSGLLLCTSAPRVCWRVIKCTSNAAVLWLIALLNTHTRDSNKNWEMMQLHSANPLYVSLT